jgi:Transposase DNA-binding
MPPYMPRQRLRSIPNRFSLNPSRFSGCEFRDARLGDRFRKPLTRIGSAMGRSIPLVCQDWANTKAAYRFFSNDRVSEADILAGHFQSTRDRAAAAEGLILVLHDTTEFSGITKSINSGRDKAGRLRSHTVCGILMHSSLAVTIEGVPLGLAAVKFWTRKKFKGTAALKKKIIRPGFPSRRRKASDGWRISSSLCNSWIIRDDASIW